MIYIIDIREEHEVLKERIIINNNINNIILFSIPSRHIKWNKEAIEYLSQENKENKVYIVCRSSRRSNKVKNDYFSDNDNIISIEGGLNNIEKISPNIKVQKENKNIFQTYGIQQYMQLLFAILLSITLLLITFKVPILYITIWLVSLILFIIYQLYTKSCLLSQIINSIKN